MTSATAIDDAAERAARVQLAAARTVTAWLCSRTNLDRLAVVERLDPAGEDPAVVLDRKLGELGRKWAGVAGRAPGVTPYGDPLEIPDGVSESDALAGWFQSLPCDTAGGLEVDMEVLFRCGAEVGMAAVEVDEFERLVFAAGGADRLYSPDGMIGAVRRWAVPAEIDADAHPGLHAEASEVVAALVAVCEVVRLDHGWFEIVVDDDDLGVVSAGLDHLERLAAAATAATAAVSAPSFVSAAAQLDAARRDGHTRLAAISAGELIGI